MLSSFLCFAFPRYSAPFSSFRNLDSSFDQETPEDDKGKKMLTLKPKKKKKKQSKKNNQSMMIQKSKKNKQSMIQKPEKNNQTIISEKPKKKKKKESVKGKRILISINVLGSAGAFRFVVNEEMLVAEVIETALKSYAREGRLPVLGDDLNDFLLYSANAGADALSPSQTIGSGEGRTFVLYKKPQPLQPTRSPQSPQPTKSLQTMRSLQPTRSPQSPTKSLQPTRSLEPIRSTGEEIPEAEKQIITTTRKGNGKLKAWISRSLSLV